MIKPLPAEIRASIERFREDFARAAPIRRLVLFGSLARGAWDFESSDVDLLVLVDEATPDLRRKASDLACREIGKGVLLSPKVFSVERFERRLAEGWLFEKGIEREGIDLTEAAS